MPLLAPHQLAAGQITDLARNLVSHFSAGTYQLNKITEILLALNNDNLAAFGNSLGPAEMEGLLTVHATQGAGLNALIVSANAVLATVGLPAATAAVDVTPFNDKLALQRREIVLADGVFTVVDFPPVVVPEEEAPPVVEEPPVIEEEVPTEPPVIEEEEVPPVVDPEVPPVNEEEVPPVVEPEVPPVLEEEVPTEPPVSEEEVPPVD
jgi:hypothetical protein